MDRVTQLSCACGTLELEVRQAPIITAECYCHSCRDAAERMAGLPGAPAVVGAHGATHFVLYRGDRVRITKGRDWLRNFRLGPEAQTRRVIATCCNTPVLLEFKGGHWVSLYGNLWHGQALPKANLRTMVGDRADAAMLDGSIPSGGWETTRFYAKLLGAWIAMGFKAPSVALDTPEIELARAD